MRPSEHVPVLDDFCTLWYRVCKWWRETFDTPIMPLFGIWMQANILIRVSFIFSLVGFDLWLSYGFRALLAAVAVLLLLVEALYHAWRRGARLHADHEAEAQDE
jgi:hypothetical protein